MGVTLVRLYSNYTPFGGLHQIFLEEIGDRASEPGGTYSLENFGD